MVESLTTSIPLKEMSAHFYLKGTMDSKEYSICHKVKPLADCRHRLRTSKQMDWYSTAN
jgi:hypothetical protein